MAYKNSNATQIQGRRVSDVVPRDHDVLRYNSETNIYDLYQRTTEKTVYEVSDFPTPVDLEDGFGVAIHLDNGINYRIDNPFLEVDYPFVVDPGYICTLSSAHPISNILAYTGSGAMFRSDNLFFLGLYDMNILAYVGDIYDITSQIPGAGVAFFRGFLLGGDSIGTVENVDFFSVIAAYLGFNNGATFNNNFNVVLNNTDFLDWNNAENAIFISLYGSMVNCSIANDTFLPNSNESVLYVDEGHSVNSGIVTSNGYNNLFGGSFFANNSKRQSDPFWTYTANANITDSTAKAEISISGNLLTTTISAQSTPTEINSIWSDGRIEERFVFLEECIFDNTTNIITSTFNTIPFNHNLNLKTVTASTIAFNNNGALSDTITDSANGFLSAGFKENDRITITGSSSNNKVCTIKSVTAGTITLINTEELTTESAGSSVTITKQDLIQFFTYSGTLPSEISSVTNYYVITDTATTFKITTERGGFEVNFTDNGTGTNWYQHTTGTVRHGRAMYIGLQDISVRIGGWGTILGTSGTNTEVNLIAMKVDINNNFEAFQKGSIITVNSSRAGASIMEVIIDLKTNESFEIYIENQSSTKNLVITDSLITANKA